MKPDPYFLSKVVGKHCNLQEGMGQHPYADRRLREMVRCIQNPAQPAVGRWAAHHEGYEGPIVDCSWYSLEIQTHSRARRVNVDYMAHDRIIILPHREAEAALFFALREKDPAVLLRLLQQIRVTPNHPCVTYRNDIEKVIPAVCRTSDTVRRVQRWLTPNHTEAWCTLFGGSTLPSPEDLKTLRENLQVRYDQLRSAEPDIPARWVRLDSGWAIAPRKGGAPIAVGPVLVQKQEAGYNRLTWVNVVRIDGGYGYLR